MIGMPLICAAVLFFGLRAVVGPIPKVSPVQRVKEGDIGAGMPAGKVLKLLGDPKEIHSNPDGTTDLVYTRTVADPELAVEVATIHLSEGGLVTSASVERQAPVPPAAQAQE